METTADNMFDERASVLPRREEYVGEQAEEEREQAERGRLATAPWARWATSLSFLVPDAAALALVMFFTHIAAGVVGTAVRPVEWLVPMVGLLGISYAVAGLYQALTMHPAQELRSVGIVTTVVYFAYSTTLGLAGIAAPAVLGWLGAAWLISLVLVPVARALSRILFAQTSWWGAPVVVLASGEAGRAVIRNLKRWPEIGLKPVVLLQDDQEEREVEGVPVLGGVARMQEFVSARDISYTIVAMPDLERRSLIDVIRKCSRLCDKVFVMPDVSDAPAFWTSAPSFEGFLGYGIQHCRRNRTAQGTKRLIDVVGASLLLIMMAPLLLAVAVMIRLDSPGPIFFHQLRIGEGGRCFSVLKFRSMYVDAEQRLDEILQKDDGLQAEYEKYHKLRKDPRVTRLGKILRRYSLDEAPQLWNVLKGDMSLVGPRAYKPDELPKMDGLERIILQSRPGVSGLWQVSGRNALSFEERTKMDVHYIHNWTPWLDLYILARTLPVVWTGSGAA